MNVLSTPFAWTTPNTLQLRCRFGFDMFDEKGLGQAEQHCAFNYHFHEDSSLLLKFLQNSNSTKILKQK